jgi:hypothetical protein
MDAFVLFYPIEVLEISWSVDLFGCNILYIRQFFYFFFNAQTMALPMGSDRSVLFVSTSFICIEKKNAYSFVLTACAPHMPEPRGGIYMGLLASI